jgi:hypothetical protein
MSSESVQLVTQNIDLTQEVKKLRLQTAKDAKELESLRALVKEYRKDATRRYEREKGRSAKLSDTMFELVMGGTVVLALQLLAYLIFEMWQLFKGI